MNHQIPMKNLKKLVYQYNFLKLELDDRKEEHSELATEFESLFSDVIPKDELTEEQAIENAKKVKKKSKSPISPATKQVYKDVAKKLHPDAGGDENDFKVLNERYKNDDLLGVISIAVDRGVEFELTEEDEMHLIESIEKLNSKISHYKTTLAYIWRYGSPFQRQQVIGTLSNHLGKKIDLDSLSDKIKDMLK